MERLPKLRTAGRPAEYLSAPGKAVQYSDLLTHVFNHLLIIHAHIQNETQSKPK
jgi:hypothetical protein